MPYFHRIFLNACLYLLEGVEDLVQMCNFQAIDFRVDPVYRSEIMDLQNNKLSAVLAPY